MPDVPVIQWTQSFEHAPWFAQVVSPVRTELFASVGWRVDHKTVLLTLRPKGGSDYRTFSHHTYRSIEKAKAHAERWARAHWRQLPEQRAPLRHNAEDRPPKGYTGH